MKCRTLKSAVLISATIVICLSSCSKTADQNLPRKPIPINLTSDQTALVSSGNSFAFDIFNKVLGSSGESQNLMISPLSISTALSMALNGAAGETRDSILATLRLNGLTPEVINNSYKDLSEALLSVDSRVLITIANSVWSEKNFAVKAPFRDILTGYYDAEARSFDINDDLAYVPINNWISDKTNGLIKNALAGLDPSTVMLLVNAIYFKGKWQSQFDAAKTENGTFSKPDGSTSEVPMMKQKEFYPAYEGNGFVVAEFPYGQGNFVMDVILPDASKGISSLTPVLNSDSFNGIIAQLSKRETQLSFPRFKYGYKIPLNDILADMGMRIAFTDNADFSNISDQSLLINKILHQSFIENNEEGTEAAAVTIIEFGTTSVITDPLTLTLDHPFIYIIRETSTNSILFMGKVADPLSAGE